MNYIALANWVVESDRPDNLDQANIACHEWRSLKDKGVRAYWRDVVINLKCYVQVKHVNVKKMLICRGNVCWNTQEEIILKMAEMLKEECNAHSQKMA